MPSGVCGFNEIVLNKEIVLAKGNKTYFADLYVPSCKLDIEYDSKEFHSSASELSKDRERAAHLESEGYRVVSVGYSQLSNLEAFRNLAAPAFSPHRENASTSVPESFLRTSLLYVICFKEKDTAFAHVSAKFT